MYEHLKGIETLVEETHVLFESITHDSAGRVVIDSSDAVCLEHNLRKLYYDKGLGFKMISNLLGNTSYSRLRTVFDKLGIEKRKGTSCVTDNLKKIRAENAKKKGVWKNWPEKLKDRDCSSRRHFAGWYMNKSTGQYVWLRSSWEYAYAKWLDKNKVVWDVEVRNYLLSDGRYYRPDFFIYEDDCLKKIVEIKAHWNNGAMDRIDKYNQFCQEYSNIPCELITEELFEIVGEKFYDVLQEWKFVRLLKKEE